MSSMIDHFWDKVSPEPNSGCWLWIGGCNGSGYGQLSFNGKQMAAHRWFYEHFKHPIPDYPIGILDHLCRVRCCVNPAHLEVVSNRVNVLRGIGYTAENARKTHCPSGHPYSGDNLYVDPDGKRECRTCRRKYSKKYSAKRKMARARQQHRG